MHINFRNKEPNSIVKSDEGCSQLFKNEKLGLDSYVMKFINAITKGDDDKFNDVREGVIGIVAPWGSGKSFFLNYLFCKIKTNYSVVYMDGSDYRNDENIELSVLKAIYKSNTVKEKLQKTAFNIVKNLGNYAVKKGISHFFKDEDNIKDILEEIGNKTINDFTDSFTENPQDKLKKELAKTAKDHPLIIIIDNLDRCDADFTLTFLTKIRNIFDIQNLLFIVAYDKMKIKDFIKQKFGEDSTSDFLRKYVSAEFYLPNFESSVINLIKHFYDEGKFDEMTGTSVAIDPTDKSDDQVKEKPLKYLAELYKNTALSFRMIEQIIKNSSRVVEQNKFYYKDDNKRITNLFCVYAKKYLYEDDYYKMFYGKKPNNTENECEENMYCEDFEEIQKQIELLCTE